MGKSQHFLIIKDFGHILNDESSEVVAVAVKHLEGFLSLFVKKDSNGILNDSQQMPSHQYVLKRIVDLEDSINQTYKYSLQSEILKSFSLLPWLICTNDLIDKILPILRNRIQSVSIISFLEAKKIPARFSLNCFFFVKKRTLPVRLAAIRAMLAILRRIPRAHTRNMYLTDLIELSVHSSCHKRIQFIDTCRLVLELYSKKFFKNYFYQNVILLADDRVANVKISFIKLLVDLKKLWKFSTDREKLENLDTIARKLLHDKDKDVFDLAQKAILQMDLIKPYITVRIIISGYFKIE